MRYLEIKSLLEYDRSKTVASLGGAIEQRAQTDTYLKSQKVNPVDAVLQQAEEADPTANKQYVVWIVRQYVKNGLKYEDIYKLKDDLETFVKTKGQHKRLGINSDIGQYNWKTLTDVAAKLSNTELSTGDPSGDVKDAKILYNGPLGILSIPETREASCALGSGTKWCTAASDEKQNMYNYYSKYGPLYIWHDKKLKQKFQFHFETGQFMNAQDQALDLKDARYFFDQNPVTAKLFRENKRKLDDVLENFLSYVNREPEEDEYGFSDRAPTELEEIATEANFVFLLYPMSPRELVLSFKNASELGEYLKELLMQDNSRRQEFNKEFIKLSRETPARAAFTLVKSIYKQPMPELEDIIAHDGKSSYLYAFHGLKGPFPKGEDAIAKDTFSSLMYATKILKKRWPPGEEAIKQSSASWRDYQTQLGLVD
jgi:hypothetical protein